MKRQACLVKARLDNFTDQLETRIYLLGQTGVVGADGIDSAGDGSQFSESGCEHLDWVQSETSSKVVQ